MRRTRSALLTGALALLLASYGGSGGGGATSAQPPTPISISWAATASVAENSTGIAYQLTTAGGSGTAAYTLGGADALFDTTPAVAFTEDASRNLYLATSNGGIGVIQYR